MASRSGKKRLTKKQMRRRRRLLRRLVGAGALLVMLALVFLAFLGVRAIVRHARKGGKGVEQVAQAEENIADTTTRRRQETPSIIGADDITLMVGDEFDVLAGVSATGFPGDQPAVTADIDEIDTSYPHGVTIVYTAEDSKGNKAVTERTVSIAGDVINNTISGEELSYNIFWDNSGIADQPYLVAVNQSHNTVTVYSKDSNGDYSVPDRAFLCSVGDVTPNGYFYTLDRYEWKELFYDSYGQYATRIVDHILFHSVPYYYPAKDCLEYEEFNLLGQTASSGCVRLCVADAKWIYDNCPAGFPCVIYEDPGSPGPLGKPDRIVIDTSDETLRCWDPTDPDPANPWLSQ